MKHKVWLALGLAVIFASVSFAAAVNPVIKSPSKYRVIDKTSEAAIGSGIKGVGIGNVLFSTKEMPKGKESTFEDVRNSFTFGTDTAIYCRMYFPGTYGSLIKTVKSRVKGATFIKTWSRLAVEGPSSVDLKAEMASSDVSNELDWDQQRYDLLPYVGGDKQDFNKINLSQVLEEGSTGEYKVYLDKFLQFQAGSKWVTRTENGALVTVKEPIIYDYLISFGKFIFIKN